MNEFIEFCKAVAPVISVISGLITIALIPMLRKLGNIDTNLAILATKFAGHEALDETRFKALERRQNELLPSTKGDVRELNANASAGVR